MKRKWYLLVGCLIMFLSGCRPVSLTERISTGENLSTITHYNSLVFDYFEAAQGAMDGALAIGGTAQIGTSGQFDIGAAAYRSLIGTYQNPNGYPSLLLNGRPEIGKEGYSSVNIYGGPVLMSENLESYYNNSKNKFQVSSGGVVFGNHELIEDFFHNAYRETAAAVNVLQNGHTAEGKTNATLNLSEFMGWNPKPGVFNNLTRYEPDNIVDFNNLKILLIHINDSGHVEINAPQFTSTMAAYDLIILDFANVSSAKFSGASVLIDGIQINSNAVIGTADNQTLKTYAEKIIWSFPIASVIQMSGSGVIGSILAPDALVEGSGGSVAGMVISDSLIMKGGMSLLGFELDERVFDLENPGDIIAPLGSAMVRKYDNSQANTTLRGQLLLEGTQFALFKRNEDGSYQEYRQDEVYQTGLDGMIVINELPEGRYYLQEIKAAHGYYHSDEKYYFAINSRLGTRLPVMIEVPNEPILTNVTLRKVDEDNQNIGLSGGRFLLYQVNGRNVVFEGTYYPDTEGYIYLDNLGYGLYRLIEIEAPDGYENRSDEFLDIVIDGDGQGNITIGYRDYQGNDLDVESGAIYQLLNKKAEFDENYRLVVTKTDIEDLDYPLSGAEFRLSFWDEDDWVVLYEDLVTDDYGHIILEGLLSGEYKLEETKPPVGYGVLDDEEHVFKIEYVERFLGRSSTRYLEIYNKPMGTIIIEEADVNDEDKKLSGAEFYLYYEADPGRERVSSNWEQVGFGETDEHGLLIFENLKPGKYQVIYSKAPEGYKQLEAPEPAGSAILSYIKNEEGDTVYYPPEAVLELKAEAEQGVAHFRKVDGDIYDSVETTEMDGLTGAIFDLYQFEIELNEWILYQNEISIPEDAADGRFSIQELPIGNYKLIETQAPAGYQLSGKSDVEVIFAIDGDSDALIGEIVIRNYLSGAEEDNEEKPNETLPGTVVTADNSFVSIIFWVVIIVLFSGLLSFVVIRAKGTMDNYL